MVSLNATTIESVATLSVTKLVFATQKADNISAAKPIVLSDTGAAPLIFTGVSITASLNLASGTTCTKTALEPKATCTLQVTFQSTSTGATTGAIIITDVSFAHILSILLTGTGG